jgi:prolyl-tRNA synthetase
MRLSKSIWQTYKEAPSDAVVISHQLMLRAGLIHKTGAGLYSHLPFGFRVVRKVEQIVREEMDAIDSQEVLMSMVTPSELWAESGRWATYGEGMSSFKDKSDRTLCLSPTNEEAATDIFRKLVKSYKQLPTSVYQINTKFRDEIRPRFGLMRSREFIMKDAYSFDLDKEALNKTYEIYYKAYEKIFDRIGFEYSAVEADAGAMADGDQKTHEFQVIADSGEDEIIYCEKTGYAANIEKAQTSRANLDFKNSNDQLKKIETPNMATIEDVCNFLKSPQHHSLKSLVYEVDGELVLLLLLGDDQLNELKLANALSAEKINPASEGQLKEARFVKGFIGPVEWDGKIKIIFDKSIDMSAQYVTGANEVDLHYSGFTPKNLKESEVHDLRLAQSGDQTIDGKGIVEIKRGIEVGQVFQLGDKYTKSMGATVLDNNGKQVTPLMGCYGIGITRVVAAAVEQNHDENGIIWPKAIAPYHVYFVLVGKSDEIKELANEIYEEMLRENIEVIFDDRKVGPGFKFKDADLLGLPYKLVLGERDYNKDGLLEIKDRKSGDSQKVKKEDVVSTLKGLLSE